MNTFMFRFTSSLLMLMVSIFLCHDSFGQKKLYIPNEWRDTSNNIPWDSTNRCEQSANFAVFWGPQAGNDPLHNTDPAYNFDPQRILDSMEAIWSDYVYTYHLIPDSGSIAQYKNIIVINNTWRDGLYTGYAFGSGYDNTVGAFWVDKGAFYEGNSFTISHEFAHSCQYIITFVLYPGHGFRDVASGFFWETHAQFMAWQRNRSLVSAMDPARGLNFTSYNMSSARKHYANAYYLELLKDMYGLDFVNRIWREANADSEEHPFQTIERLLGGGQAGVNNFFLQHAMHNVKWDYKEVGGYIRQAMAGMDPEFQWRPTILLDSLGTGRYAVPDNLAPQQYGYDIVRLYKTDSSCGVPYVHMKFKGHKDANAGSGWLYGFVSTDANGNITYSNAYSDSEVTYKFPVNSTEFYLVVLGAPDDYRVHKDMFEVGFPKEFRYPWEINIAGMIPNGYQPRFHNVSGIAGARHANGGGFVAATAYAAPTAYVAPNAVVLDKAQVLNNARVEGKAMVRGNAVISNSAVVSGFADVMDVAKVSGTAKVGGSAKLIYNNTISDNSVVSDNAVLSYATISGGTKAFGNLYTWGGNISNKAEFGGDAEIFVACSAGGRYLHVEGLSPAPGSAARAFCDGRYNNILNKDTNAAYTKFTAADMAFGQPYDCASVLPVSLLSFKGSKQGNATLLTWQTTNETGNAWFDVLRATNNADFIAIGRVKAHGNGAAVQSYSFTDLQPAQGKNEYKLQQVDNNGNASFSGIVSLSFDNMGKLKAWFSSPSRIYVSVPQSDKKGELMMYDMEGRLLSAKTISAGASSATIDASSFAKGIYVLRYGNQSVKLTKP